jgi:hypothetical protein
LLLFCCCCLLCCCLLLVLLLLLTSPRHSITFWMDWMVNVGGAAWLATQPKWWRAGRAMDSARCCSFF